MFSFIKRQLRVQNRFTLAGVAVPLISLCATVVVAVLKPNVAEQIGQRIQVGMTMTQVEDVVGRPQDGSICGTTDTGALWNLFWQFDDGSVSVTYLLKRGEDGFRVSEVDISHRSRLFSSAAKCAWNWCGLLLF